MRVCPFSFKFQDTCHGIHVHDVAVTPCDDVAMDVDSTCTHEQREQVGKKLEQFLLYIICTAILSAYTPDRSCMVLIVHIP